MPIIHSFKAHPSPNAFNSILEAISIPATENMIKSHKTQHVFT